MTDRYLPPPAHLRPGPVGIFDAAFARWIVEQTNYRAVFAARGRDADRSVYSQLAALFELAAEGSEQGSDPGTSVAREAEPRPRSVVSADSSFLLGAATAAGLIGISDRAVRKAITEKRLPAQIIDGRYVIERADIENYRAARRAA